MCYTLLASPKALIVCSKYMYRICVCIRGVNKIILMWWKPTWAWYKAVLSQSWILSLSEFIAKWTWDCSECLESRHLGWIWISEGSVPEDHDTYKMTYKPSHCVSCLVVIVLNHKLDIWINDKKTKSML